MSSQPRIAGDLQKTWNSVESKLMQDASDAWNWTTRQATWAGKEIVQGADWAATGIMQGAMKGVQHEDAKLFHYRSGHYYHKTIPLGHFPKLTPRMLLEAIRNNPESFPLPASRKFELGAIVELRFLRTINPVKVMKITESDPDRASMLLLAMPPHMFAGGTAEHSILRLRDKQLAYDVVGHGPKRELVDRYEMNMGFADLWKTFVQWRVKPLAEKLEQQLEKTGRTR